MRFVLLLCAVVAATCSLVYAGPRPGYTLYYLDESHNVRAQVLDAGGHPVGNSTRLTSFGGYDDYSVSPNGDFVMGFRQISAGEDEDVDLTFITWKSYLEPVGGKRSPRALRITESIGPSAHEVKWSRSGRHVTFIEGMFDVEGGPIYSTKSGKQVGRFSAELGPISRDERLAVIGLQPADEGLEAWVLDLETGRRTRIQEGIGDCVWIGDTYKLAGLADYADVWTAEVERTSSAVCLRSRTRLHAGNCTDLRYIPGKGLYFVDGPLETGTPYYSKDFKTVSKGERLPNRYIRPAVPDAIKQVPGAWIEYAQCSPGGDLIACPVDKGHNRLPEIRIFDRHGNSWPVARGKVPTWKSAESVWTSWTSPF